jgi:hypothetical protein
MKDVLGLTTVAVGAPCLVARLLWKHFEQNARGSGLTRSQWQVPAYLAQNEGINQSGLADRPRLRAVFGGGKTFLHSLDAQQTLDIRSHSSG